jgi:hypothetical protein
MVTRLKFIYLKSTISYDGSEHENPIILMYLVMPLIFEPPKPQITIWEN